MSEGGKKIKYDAEYISYVEHGESAAVFITRDIVKAIKTQGKWIDVLDIVNAEKFEDYNRTRWRFESFDVEIFPRKSKPIYPEGADQGEINYITWQTAQRDIKNLRDKGYVGQKFRIRPKLVNVNRGKYRTG